MSKSPSLPAVCGGAPLCAGRIPPWPRFDDRGRAALMSVYDSGLWGCHQGERTSAFAQAFAQAHGNQYGVCAVNGTMTLVMALQALRLQPGDEVIVPAYTFVATASSVLLAGGVPKFADIDPDTLCISAASAAEQISPRTRGIIPVHLGGHPADMDQIGTLARSSGLWIIEDCAQAHGSSWRGQPVGALGHIGSFSFQASKNMTAGEGGIVVTNDRSLYERCWSLHSCGRLIDGAWYDHHLLGGNLRMTEFQAALLHDQLADLPSDNTVRADSAQTLKRLLNEIPGLEPIGADGPGAVGRAYHLFTLRYDPTAFGGLSRAGLVSALRAEGVPASTGYSPLYRAPLFANLETEAPVAWAANPCAMDYSKVVCPVTEEVSRTVVWLPQNVLLAPHTVLERIRSAIERIRSHAGLVRTATDDHESGTP